jgi:CheY-like chemotaxis protein
MMLRIVVAEDDAPIRELLVHHLAREGFRCTETADGPSTLRAVRAGADVVILDVGCRSSTASMSCGRCAARVASSRS